MPDAAVETPIAIAVVQYDDCYLIGRRPPGVPLAGLWEFPGGKVQAGESAAAAAVRECWEETEIRVRIVGPLGVQQHSYTHGLLRLHFYHCRPTDVHVQPASPFLWVPRHELLTYEFPEANRAVLQRLP